MVALLNSFQKLLKKMCPSNRGRNNRRHCEDLKTRLVHHWPWFILWRVCLSTFWNLLTNVWYCTSFEEVERHVYYLSRSFRGAEMNHSPIERHCFVLIFARQKLRHNLLTRCINLVKKSNSFKYVVVSTSYVRRMVRGRSNLMNLTSLVWLLGSVKLWCANKVPFWRTWACMWEPTCEEECIIEDCKWCYVFNDSSTLSRKWGQEYYYMLLRVSPSFKLSSLTLSMKLNMKLQV